ncbi:MAG: hypothetical protein FJ276_37290, partial [Planctomycetes bacterium]|nr:hypothetical protein [Planctomycetota bacterium]
RMGRAGESLLAVPIQSPNVDALDDFGSSVAVLGNDILVAAPKARVGTDRVGAVYLVNGDTGAHVRTISNPYPSHGDLFGAAIAVVGGNVLIGAPGEDADGNNAGMAYLFNGSTGALLAEYHNPTPAEEDRFGSSIVAIGDKVLVGAPGDDTLAANGGAAYLFDLAGNRLWTYTNPDADAEDAFGATLAALGDRAVIGALGNDPAVAGSGVVYLYETSGGYRRLQTFANPTPDAGDGFGRAVAGVGDKVVVTASNENGNAGMAYVFDAVTGEIVMALSDPTPSADEHFGHSVAVSGNDILIGAVGDRESGAAVGKVYLFDGLTGVMLYTFANPSPADGDAFGLAVAATDSRVAISAPGDDTGQTDAGSVYLFDATREVHTTTTGPDGGYTITGLTAGTYAVARVPQAGWWPTYPGRLSSESRVNASTAGLQQYPAVAMDAAGNYVAVWQSDHAGTSSWGVFGQRYDSAGQPAGLEFQVNTQPIDGTAFPDIAMDADGDFVVTWGRLGNVQARRYSATGEPAGDEFSVNTLAGEHRDSVIAMDADGNFVIAWQR